MREKRSVHGQGPCAAADRDDCSLGASASWCEKALRGQMRVTVPHCKLSSGCIWSSGLPPLPGRRARQICGQKTSAAGRAGQWSAANLNLIKGSESSAMPASHIVRCLVVQHSALQLHVTPGDVELRLAQSLPLPQSRPHLHSSNYAPIRYAAAWPCPAPRAQGRSRWPYGSEGDEAAGVMVPFERRAAALEGRHRLATESIISDFQRREGRPAGTQRRTSATTPWERPALHWQGTGMIPCGECP